MRFLSKFLPLITLTLLIALIYYGVKQMFQYIDDNPEAYQAHLVTKNEEEGFEDETYDIDGSYNDADHDNLAEDSFSNESDFDAAEEEEDFDKDEDFEDDLANVKLDNPEATLDAELEGKSSNQLISSLKKKETKSSSTKKATSSKTKKKSTTNSSTTKGSTKSKSMGIAAANKTNAKPLRDKLTVKGSVPTAYDSSSATQFMVIAGSFKSKDNANTYIDELEKKGLRNLEIIELRSKNLNRVVVSRHPSYAAAKKSINELKMYYNVDAYVHRPTN